MNTSIQCILCCIFLSIGSIQAAPVYTRIPNDSAGVEGIFLRIDLPATQRYPEGAPIVIYGPGGFKSVGEDERETGLTGQGFIEIRLNFHGSGLPGHESGGTYDHRGVKSLNAIRDVFRFLRGDINSLHGATFTDLIHPIQPLLTNIGMIGWSNGGNTIICAAGRYGPELEGLAWLLGWESPVGDGMPQAECGAKSEGNLRPLNPEINAAYDDTGGTWDLSTLKYDPQIQIPILDDIQTRVTGGFYFDFNGDNLVDPGADFILYPLVFEKHSGHQAYYSERIRKYTELTGIDNTPPAHLPSVQKTHTFWSVRNGDYWIDSVIVKHPKMMYMVVASDTDHVQRSPAHPHILNQYGRFINAGARFVRLNPDRSYVEAIMGITMPEAVDNDAFSPFTPMNIKSGVEPGNSEKDAFNKVHVAAAGACELADRTYYDNTDTQIDHILTSVEFSSAPLPESFRLFQNYPNPFNRSSVVRYQLPKGRKVFFKVYNITGGLVLSERLGYKKAGNHHIFINVNGWSTGIYTYEVIADQFRGIGKMLLVR